ncbi:ComEC/Rec2 family competence protein [Moritella sp. 24]|nr:ComEC/Rec2 family competence protein [Moritella sp. 24]
MFFVDIERIQYITIMTVTAFIFYYIKLPPTFVLIFVVLSWSILYKNSVINEANTLFQGTPSQYKQAPIKVAHDNIITAKVITLVNKKNLLSFDVKVIKIGDEVLSALQPTLALSWPSADYNYPGEVGIGQIWRFKIRLTNSNAYFDENNISSFKSRLLSRHIQYSGMIKKGEILNSNLTFRGDLYQVFRSLLPSKPNPLLYALTFGDRSYITDELWYQFKLLGIGHLVAISGLHIGLIFGFSFICVQGLLRLCRCQYYLFISLSFGLMSALFYAWIAGFSLPALRAIVLLSLHCLYRFQHYKITLLQMFSTMLVVTLLFDPLTVFSISFWLSFSAIASVFVLIWLIQKEHINLSENNRVKYVLTHCYNKCKRVFYSQVLLTLFILPLQATVFSGFSWISVVVNLIFIPVFSVLVLPVLLTAVMLFTIAPRLSQILIHVVNELLNLILLAWEKLTVDDVIWFDLEVLSSTASYHYCLMIFILLLAGFIFKPLRVAFHSLSLLLLPLYFYSAMS